MPVRAAFCETCDLAVERLPPSRCRTCAEPGTFPRDTCPRCHLSPPPFTRAAAPFAHEGPVARAIHRFKYEDHPELRPRPRGAARLRVPPVPRAGPRRARRAPAPRPALPRAQVRPDAIAGG
ncbi:hypothetical protein ACN28I_21010 [Archangium gephyra]|uniref:hypothetical protein n=1 Tax=Archangium gephyra TaxID=48 RepID=UPI003B7CFA55